MPMKRTTLQFGYSVLIYIIGLFFMALGVAFSVNANLGISPVNSLPYVVSLITEIDFGTCIILVFSVYILLQVVILRKEFKLIYLTQLIFSSCFGYFTTFCKWLLGDFTLPTYAGQLVMLAISIILIAIGVLCYIAVDLVPMPMEGLSLAAAQKTGKPFHNVKITLDCVVVVVSVALSLLFLGELDGIREGTLITALVVGKVMGVLKKPIEAVVKAVCFGK